MTHCATATVFVATKTAQNSFNKTLRLRTIHVKIKQLCNKTFQIIGVKCIKAVSLSNCKGRS